MTLNVTASDYITGIANESSIDNGNKLMKGYSNSTYSILNNNGENLILNVTVSSPYVPGIIADTNIHVPGTGYSNSVNVPTHLLINSSNQLSSGGNGLTVDITTNNGEVTNVIINNPGSRYLVGDELVLLTGNYDAHITVTQVNSEGGNIETVSIVEGGSNYTIDDDTITIDNNIPDEPNAEIKITNVYSTGGNIEVISIANHGENYTEADEVTFNLSTNVNFTVIVDRVISMGGEINNLELNNSGENYLRRFDWYTYTSCTPQ